MRYVSKEMLQPMCDAPSGVPILVSTGRNLREAYVSESGVVNFTDCNLFDTQAFGWIPIPELSV